ncbi:hypothetical protein [Archangium lipolyticum]|uniref:hypothetical protein n=1 Tax=Archangium lipolyticum TaxID=2970465 RepID=UPI002149F5FA|nr:hypothetical protein [Archangium lipolyticum]
MPLLERLEALRQPGITLEEVDTFLNGLSAPLPPGEPPRVRADLMLDVLEDERLCELTGTDGHRVGVAALEALLELGYPYALEVTPEMLTRARGAPRLAIPRPMLFGLGLALLNVLGQAVIRLSDSHPHLIDSHSHHHHHLDEELMEGAILGRWEDLPLVGLVLLGAPVFSALAEWYALRPVKHFFNLVQWGVSGFSLLFALQRFDEGTWPQGMPFLFSGLLALGTVLCLTPRHDREP